MKWSLCREVQCSKAYDGSGAKVGEDEGREDEDVVGVRVELETMVENVGDEG